MRIEKQFEELLPPLTDEEFRQLEENILRDGIRDPLVVWKTPSGNEVLVDGHNRLKIAQKHNLKYETVYMTFDDFDDVKLWIWRTQAGRRNLKPFQRAEVALKIEPILKKEGRKRMSDGGKGLSTLSNLNTRKEIAEKAKISEGSLRKVKHILDKGSDETKAKVRSGEYSIDQAYKQMIKENEPPKPDIPTIEEEHAAFVEKKKTATVVTMEEIQDDKENQRLIAIDTSLTIRKAIAKMEDLMTDERTSSIAKVAERAKSLTQEEKQYLITRMQSILNFANGIIRALKGE